MTRTTRRRLERAGVVVCGLLAAALAAALVHAALLASGRGELTRQARAALALQARTVESILAKHRHLPAQLAHRRDVRALFARDGAAGEVEDAGDGAAIASNVAGLTGAADIAFLDARGRIVAAARERFSGFAPAILRRVLDGPREGRLGRSVVAPEEAGRAPGYVFSYPVRDGRGTIVGAAAVMVDLGRIEEIWALSLDSIRATDHAGRMVVANDVSLEDAPSVVAARMLAQLGWRLEIERDARAVHRAARNGAGLAALVVLALATFALALVWRRQALAARGRRDRATALVLERRVRDRTRALEVAQAELVQSAKLAALGRMSAALAHEYAQPLAAIRTYAENARTLLQQGRADAVPRAIERVVAMAERMRSLSQTLRSFAREPGSAARPVPLDEAFADALTLAQAEAKARGVEIRFEAPDAGDALVLGGRVRLSQVFLNLLTNAVAASPEGGAVRVTLSQTHEEIALRVADDGPGVPEQMREQVFEPFFTTKPVGEGLGLGLAIAYNVVRDFGGTLRLLPSGSGAVFEVRLRRAEPAAYAAAAE